MMHPTTCMTSKRSEFAGSKRMITHRPTVPAAPSRGSLKVNAAGKGKKTMRTGPGGGRGSGSPQGGPQMPPTPPVDPENVEFVIFARSKKLPQWFPVSITKGGSGANLLVKSLETEWGRTLYSNTLVQNIGRSIYAEKEQIINMIKNSNSMMRDAKDFEFGFKIRDRSDPKAWMFPTADLIILPAENELGGTVIDNIQAFLGQASAAVPAAPQ